MKIISRQIGNAPLKYYKYTQGLPVFGSKGHAVRMSDEVAAKVMEQLNGLGVSGCALVNDVGTPKKSKGSKK